MPVDTDHERQPDAAGDPRGEHAHAGDRHQQREQRAGPWHAEAACDGGDGVRDTGDRADAFLGQRDQQRRRAEQVERRDQCAGNDDGARDHPPRLADLAAHQGRELQADEREHHGRERLHQRRVVEVGQQVTGEVARTAVAPGTDEGRPDQRRQHCAHQQRAAVRDALGRLQPDEVDADHQPQHEQRHRGVERCAVPQARPERGGRLPGGSCDEQQQGREEDQVRYDVAPARDEAVRVAECVLDPQVETAFAVMTR